MSNKSKKIKGGGLVYSTDKETMQGLFENIKLSGKVDQKSPRKSSFSDKVRVYIDRKKRAGKEVTVVQGIDVNEQELKDLAKQIKTKCGVGGSSKDGMILIQGNQREKVVKYLQDLGYRDVKMAGG